MPMPTGLGDAIKKYFGTGTPKAGAAPANLAVLKQQLRQAMMKEDYATADKIRQQIAAISGQK